MQKRERLFCGDCDKPQMSVPGRRCRFCGGTQLNAVKRLSDPGDKLTAFLEQESMSNADFRRGAKLDRLSNVRLASWKRGHSSPLRNAAIRIASLVRRKGYPVWACPFYHPHAAMRVYRKEYHTFWRTNREWFRTNPGKDPGPWWNTFKPEGTTNEQ